MPDLGLPRALARGERREAGTACRGVLSGRPFWVLGRERAAPPTRQPRMQAGFCPVRFAHDKHLACRALFILG